MAIVESLARNTGGEKRGISPELSLAPHAVDVLRGKVVPALKNGRLICAVLEGSGQFGLTNWEDSKKWAGIFHHSLLTGRIASYFSARMKNRGHETNPQRIINTMTFSHAGRRSWEDARDFPETVDRFNGSGAAEALLSTTNEVLGLRIIKEKVPQDEFELVAALAHDNREFPVDPKIYDSLDYRLTSYVDHRTTHEYQPLHIRMAGFLINNFFDGENVDQGKQQLIEETIKHIIDRRKNFQFRRTNRDISLEEADLLIQKLGANDKSIRLSNRKDVVDLILQDAETEAILLQNGIDPDAINEETAPMQSWEDNVRKAYVAAARDEIFAIIDRIAKPSEDGTIDSAKIRDETTVEFPPDKWWTIYVRKLNQERWKINQSKD